MSGVFERIVQGYNEYVVQKADRRTDNLFLVPSAVLILLTCIVYILFVKKWGPMLMENRKPFKIQGVMTLYNIVQIIANAYIFLMGTIFIIPYYSSTCEPVDYSDNAKSRLVLYLCYIYFLIKVSDLLDTVFFILRKKYTQVTFLHIYHHSIMVLTSWFSVRYVGGGHSVYVGYPNSIVHIFMYSYYLMSSRNDKCKKIALSLKKYITQLQLMQFVVILCFFMSTLLKEDCTYPRSVALYFMLQDIIIAYLFWVFYRSSYLKPNSKTPKLQN